MIATEIITVLVRPIYEANIGAASRGLSNMGFSRLIVIDRKCEITYAAQMAAATGQEALQYRKEYASWQDFFAHEPDGIRLAFSAKDGRARPVWDTLEVLNWLKTEHPLFQKQTEKKVPVYLIFGPEDWGLSNSDLELVHYSLVLPTYGENSSLNLAQAVLLALFCVRQAWGGDKTILDGAQESRTKNRDENIFPERSLRSWLETMGFQINSKKINVYTVLKRMLLHQVPTSKELRILETALQQSIRKMKNPSE